MILYDTGALIAANRGSKTVWSLHRQTVAHGMYPLVPTVVLAQAWRGGPAHNMARLLKGCVLLPDVTESTARAAGELCAKAGTTDVVDALVVLYAERTGARMVVTTDPADLTILANAAGSKLALHTV